MTEPTSADHCPRCGGTNDCTLAAGGTITDCWCLNRDFSATTLSADNPQSCLCRQCTSPRSISTPTHKD